MARKTRRSFLVAAGVALVTLCTGYWAWLRRVPSAEDGTGALDRSAARESLRRVSELGLFPADDSALFLAVADVIVPRDGPSPAASEIDLIPKIEKWLAHFPGRVRAYQRLWPHFRAVVHRDVKVVSGRFEIEALSVLCERLHDEVRMARRPSPEAEFFEMLRRHVLRAYYASSAGQRYAGYVGYAGSARSLPMDAM